MFSKGQDYICVYLTDDTLKMAHFKVSPAEKKLINVVKKDLGESPEDEIPNIIQSTYASLNVKNPKTICVVSSSLTTTKNIEIPSTDPEEISSIIDLQAGRHTPYSREEILIGYNNIGVHSRNYTKVLLVIINREIIKKQLGVFDTAGLRIERIFFAPEGKSRFFGKIQDIKNEDAPLGIIDVGKFSTDFTIEFCNNVIACRNIPLGMSHLIKEGQEAADKLTNELVQSLESYQNEDIEKVPETFLITSDDAKLKDLQPILQEKLKVNVKVQPYLDHVVADQPVMLKIVSEYDDESFLDIISPFGVLDSMHIDLLPEEVKTQHAIEEQSSQMVRAGVFSLILLLLVCASFFTKIYFRGLYLDRLKEEFEAKEAAVKQLEQISTNTGIIKDYLKSRMESLDVVHELYDKIPNEIYLKTITLDDKGKIYVQGVSETRSTAFAFITILENSKLFKNAKMISSSAKKERGKDVSAFEISFKLESAKDDPESEAGAEAEGEPEEIEEE